MPIVRMAPAASFDFGGGFPIHGTMTLPSDFNSGVILGLAATRFKGIQV